MHTWRTQEEETLPRFLDVPTYKIEPEHTLLLYYKPTAWKRKLKHQDRANVHKRWRSAGVWREREGRYWSAVGHEGRIHCVLLLTQTIDHHKETIFTKWVQFPGSSWKIRVACAVCSLQPAGRDHCVLLRAPRKLLTIPRKRSSLSGLNTRGFEGGGGALMENMGGVCGVLPKTWRVHPLRCVARTTQTIDHPKETIFTQWAQHLRVGELMENPGGVCGWGWGLSENTEGDMRCAFLNFYPNLHLICYPRRGMIKDRPWFQLVPKFTPLQPQM